MAPTGAFVSVGQLPQDTNGKVNSLSFYLYPSQNIFDHLWIFRLDFRCRLLAILEKSFSFQANHLSPTNLIHWESQAT